jgi:hypothetical protein
MKVNPLRTLFQHIRIGYVAGLLIPDTLLLVLVLRDVAAFESLKLSLSDTIQLLPGVLAGGAWKQWVGILVVLLLALPAVIGWAGVQFASGPEKSSGLRVKSWYVTATHIILCLFLSVFVVEAKCMEILSGLRAQHINGQVSYGYLFGSYVRSVVNLFSNVYVIWGGSILTVAGAVIATFALFLRQEKILDWLEDYTTRCA